MKCKWFWNNIRWVESPEYPHLCPVGTHCDPPTEPGTEYGQEAETDCV